MSELPVNAQNARAPFGAPKGETGAFAALARALAGADDVRAASWAAVAFLAGPELWPSVYIERGGRLRCQALLGYGQLLDGLPPGTGVIGRTYATGRSNVIRDVRAHADYLPAVDGVVGEACFPVMCGPRVVGAVNLEGSQPLGDDEIEALGVTARALGGRIEALGGPEPESSSQRLLRHANALAAEHDIAAIEPLVLAAAIDATPLSSALLLRRASRGVPFSASCAQGPLAPTLLRMPVDAIVSLAAIVTEGCSVYTIPGAGVPARTSRGIAALGVAGATSMALPVGDLRILVVAGEAGVRPSTEHCELLELLAAQASTSLRTAASVTTLRAQAAADPLTGLGHHATFYAELARARRAGRFGVLVIDVDAFKEYNDRHGHPAGDRILLSITEALKGALRLRDGLFRIGGDEFAALLAGVDDTLAVSIADRLRRAVSVGTALSVSIGAAVAEVDEDELGVFARADRALYSVKERGGDGVALAPRT